MNGVETFKKKCFLFMLPILTNWKSFIKPFFLSAEIYVVEKSIYRISQRILVNYKVIFIFGGFGEFRLSGTSNEVGRQYAKL